MTTQRKANKTIRDLGLIFLLHLLFSFVYYITLWFASSPESQANQAILDFEEYVDDSGLQFAVMLLGAVLIWFIIFKWLAHLKLVYRLMVHLITLPLYVLFAKDVFYLVSDYFGYWHLSGEGSTWDVFIPATFYLALFGFFHAFEYYQHNRQRMLAEAEYKADVLRSELKAIKAQLNPHFLYNVFNTINASIPREQEATREMIADLSDLLRYQLKASEVDSILLAEEVNAVKTYLRLEKKRFDDRLQIHYDIDKNCLKRRIPPMLIQPLVENAIKHGISGLTEGGEVYLTIRVNDRGELAVSVTDSGKGIEHLGEALEKGFGLRHTKERLEKFYGSQMEIKNQNPKGLSVSFTV